MIEIISQGENITTEFKQSRNQISKDVYESICAFLNRNGGNLFLGVSDNGNITGIDGDAVTRMRVELAAALNNPQKINPPLYIVPDEFTVEDKKILFLSIPESSQVHRCNGRIFDRNQDGDFDITSHADLVANLYIRKQAAFSENRIFPFVELADLRDDIFLRFKKRLRLQRPAHPWIEMEGLDFFRSSRLYQKDYSSGKEGFTLAAILLFAKDEVILSVLPAYRTDAILRRDNLDRYDDRDDIRTNLLESYDRIMAFVAKHLPDPFFLEKDVRISLRDKIFREVAANILIHREFVNAFPAKFIIERHRVFAENANRPHGHGIIKPDDFSPFPKNPVIAGIFKEIGLADELGSGIRNLYKYVPLYANGSSPELIEGDIFRTIIALSHENKRKKRSLPKNATENATENATVNATVKLSALQKAIISAMQKNNSITYDELSSKMKKDRATIHRNIQKLLQQGIIHRIGSDKKGHWEIIE